MVSRFIKEKKLTSKPLIMQQKHRNFMQLQLIRCVCVRIYMLAWGCLCMCLHSWGMVMLSREFCKMSIYRGAGLKNTSGAGHPHTRKPTFTFRHTQEPRCYKQVCKCVSLMRDRFAKPLETNSRTLKLLNKSVTVKSTL